MSDKDYPQGDYANLDRLIKNLKASAIDAYMKSQGFTRSPNGYRSDKPNAPGTGTSSADVEVVSFPNADGEGGGDWSSPNPVWNWWSSSEQSKSYKEAFAHVRKRIDDTVLSLTGLPDPESLESHIVSCRNILSKLAASPQVTDGMVQGVGDISSDVSSANTNAAQMSGTTLENFKANFLSKLDKTVGGLYSATVVLGNGLAGEKSVLAETRRSVANALVSADDACKKVAESNGAALKVLISILTSALSGVSGLFTGGVSTATVSASLLHVGLSVAKDLEDPDQLFGGEGQPVKNYEGAMSAFEGAFKEIKRQFKEAEGKIKQKLYDNVNSMKSDAHKEYFDLTLDSMHHSDIDDRGSADPSKNEAVIIQPDLVYAISNTYLPRVSSGLKDCSDNVDKLEMKVERGANVGAGHRGAAPAFEDLRVIVRQLLNDLGDEVSLASSNLLYAVQDILNTDANASTSINQAADQIDNRNRKDPVTGDKHSNPWDYNPSLDW